jgi:rod shape-determining protein MreC
MPPLTIRRRSGVLFVTMIVLHIIVISAQVPAGPRAQVPVLSAVTFGVFSEIQRLVSGGVGGLRRTWNGYVALRNVRAENEALRHQLNELEVRMQQQRALADRSTQLEKLLDLRDRSQLKMTAASVIAAGATPDFRTMTIDKGTRDGFRPDMAVIAPTGIVGRIVIPSARAAKVQLLIDRNAAVGALVERSRAQGVALGGGEERLRMEFVSDTADLKVGDIVVSSGIDGIYPKGFLIGRIERVERRAGAYTLIEVKPGVDFTTLEEVLVVTTPASPDEGEVGK